MATNDQILNESCRKQADVAVVMVPFIAQGHLNQLLHLSRLISTYNLPVHFLSTATHSHQAKLRVQGWDPLSISNILFHDCPTPSFPTPPPNPRAEIKFPDHLMPSFKAAMHLREPFLKLVSALSTKTKRIIVVHDYLMSSVIQGFISFSNVEVYMFMGCSAFFTFWYHWEPIRKPSLDEQMNDLWKIVPSLEGCFSNDFLGFLKSEDTSFKKISSGTLYDTCKVFEGKYLELLKNEEIAGTSKNWAIGPFNPVVVSHHKGSPESHKLLEWLDKQEPNSVIYVSFGTTVSFTDEQIKELAIGLEESEIKFIWVVRDADKGDILKSEAQRVELPKEFEERLERIGMGMVVRDWAPQLEILGHPTTGGFMTHCGWNSCMESITMGVPIAAWPMHSDQPRNAVLIKEVLGIGLYVRDWVCRNEIVTALMVSSAVRRLMSSEEGNKIRKRAKELGGDVRQSVEEGGDMRMELDSFIAHITR